VDIVFERIRVLVYGDNKEALMNQSFAFYWFVLFVIILSRYFLVSGGAYLLFYSNLGRCVLGHWLNVQPLRLKPISKRLIWNDIRLAVGAAAIFAIAAAFILWAYDQGITKLYTQLHPNSWFYLGLSYGLVLVLQDTYFYFIHRALHHPLLFKGLHSGHHQSGDPTPWTSFAFDLPEAIIQALFLIAVVFIIPLHFVTLIAVLLTMTGWTVLNHLGFEIFPVAFTQHWLGKWFIGATHHSIHHRRYKQHYGLYFAWWDKLLGTHDPTYGTSIHPRF
jgi:sterol desaturase/sphingolipid hydroxylase (fatty acid hydroxylase superfamily)